jgi:hypothetical protein
MAHGLLDARELGSPPRQGDKVDVNGLIFYSLPYPCITTEPPPDTE